MTPARWLVLALVCGPALWLLADLALALAVGERETVTFLVRSWATPPRLAVGALLFGFAAGAGGVGLVWHFGG